MSKRYGMVIDLERCIGCHTCTVACKLENGIEQGSWITVRTIGGDGMDTPAGQWPDLKMYYEPKPCMHCAEPPCVDACPIGAISKRDDGIVLVDREACDGCQICVAACPYDVFLSDPETGVVSKCTLCAHRVDEGLDPFCLICCQGEAIFFGDLADPDSEVARLAARDDAFVLLPGAATKPGVRYLPQMAPRGLP